ncbi:MAG: winged helix-turn-helix domain-containing protein, partial [Eubacteriales bacterium]|nr:winged helix-turn-helix domain-containing protein [Eubacteriales bacterium]
TNMEFRLLHFLFLNPGLVFTRDQLLDSVWDTGYAGDTRTVDMHVRTLRVKLGQGAGCVRTVRGVGYKLAETGQEA